MSASHVATYGADVDLLAVDTDGATKKLARDVTAAGIAAALNVDGATWTPTYSNLSNLTTTVHRRGSFHRVENEVFFNLKVQFTTSGAGPTRAFDFTLPVDP